MGARYLVTGGADRPYGLAIQGIVEAPAGDSRLIGNATQVMPTLLGYYRPPAKYSFIRISASTVPSEAVGRAWPFLNIRLP